MSKKKHLICVAFVLMHLLLVAPFVPLANILPAGLGALSMTSMALSLTLAARWRIVDRIMGGPDKSYGFHRWLGFFALGGALGHWATAESFGEGIAPILAESGEGVGTVAAVGLVALTAAAMVRAIPYHLWKASHMLMGPIFLLAAYHTFFVASPLTIGAAPWTLMSGVSVLGLVAWGQTLLCKKSMTRLVTVDRAKPFDGGVDVTFTADAALPAFRPGQFATLARNSARAEAHPFTIAGGDASSRRFIIRAAGDWTDTFVQTVRPGDQYRIGAGVGRFLPMTKPSRPDQLWVAGGVGITPFLASLERMQPDCGGRITLVYCIRSRASAGAIADAEFHAARLPQVELIVVSEADGARLSPASLSAIIGTLSAEAQVYLCGPEGLKSMVIGAWNTFGKSGKVHSESFDFRGACGLTDLIYIGKPALAAARDWVEEKRNNAHAAAGSRG